LYVLHTCPHCPAHTAYRSHEKNHGAKKDEGEVKTVKKKIKKDCRKLENNEKEEKVKMIYTEKERGGGRES
jgi:hypothetical protein